MLNTSNKTDIESGNIADHNSANEMISRLKTVTRKKGRPNSSFEAVIIGNVIIFRPGLKWSRESAIRMLRIILLLDVVITVSSVISSYYWFSGEDMAWVVKEMKWIIPIVPAFGIIMGIGAVLFFRPFIKGTVEFCRIDTVNRILTYEDTSIPLSEIERFTGSDIDVYAVTRDGEEHLIMRDPIGSDSRAFITRALKVLGTTCAIPTSIESDGEG